MNGLCSLFYFFEPRLAKQNSRLVPVLAVVILLAGLPGGCRTTGTPLPPTASPPPPPPTQTPTVTPVWFPPTATFTPFPTPYITPTVEVRAEYGSLALRDTFATANAWALVRNPVGVVALGKNELSIAVSQAGGYLSSLHSGVELGDFYLEVTASPNLCRGPDEYGVLFRFTPSGDFYRFALTCAGQVRLDRLLRGIPAAIQPLTLSGAVPPGAPSSSRLGIEAMGRSLRFFVNDQFQFAVQDISIPAGKLGLFVRSNGETAVTVNFSDLAVYRVR